MREDRGYRLAIITPDGEIEDVLDNLEEYDLDKAPAAIVVALEIQNVIDKIRGREVGS